MHNSTSIPWMFLRSASLLPLWYSSWFGHDILQKTQRTPICPLLSLLMHHSFHWASHYGTCVVYSAICSTLPYNPLQVSLHDVMSYSLSWFWHKKEFQIIYLVATDPINHLLEHLIDRVRFWTSPHTICPTILMGELSWCEPNNVHRPLQIQTELKPWTKRWTCWIEIHVGLHAFADQENI